MTRNTENLQLLSKPSLAAIKRLLKAYLEERLPEVFSTYDFRRSPASEWAMDERVDAYLDIKTGLAKKMFRSFSRSWRTSCITSCNRPITI